MLVQCVLLQLVASTSLHLCVASRNQLLLAHIVPSENDVRQGRGDYIWRWRRLTSFGSVRLVDVDRTGHRVPWIGGEQETKSMLYSHIVSYCMVFKPKKPFSDLYSTLYLLGVHTNNLTVSDHSCLWQWTTHQVKPCIWPKSVCFWTTSKAYNIFKVASRLEALRNLSFLQSARQKAFIEIQVKGIHLMSGRALDSWVLQSTQAVGKGPSWASDCEVQLPHSLMLQARTCRGPLEGWILLMDVL